MFSVYLIPPKKHYLNSMNPKMKLNRKKLLAELDNMQFFRVGSIILFADGLQFCWIDPSDEKCGFVYMWVVEKNNTPAEILYIGKAGFTLKMRGQQHSGGFRRAGSTGGTLADKLRKRMVLLKKETGCAAEVAIYARHSPCKNILGEARISMCEVEETALIKKYEPYFDLFNFQKKIRQ